MGSFFAQLWAYGHMEKDGIMPTDYLYGALLLSQWLCLLAYIWLKAFNPAEESIHKKRKANCGLLPLYQQSLWQSTLGN